MNSAKYIKPVAIVLILVSLVTAFWLDYYRWGSEQANKEVGILVDYDEVVALARANNIQVDQALQKFAAVGASGVLLRERTIKDLAQTGDITVATANNLQLISRGNPTLYPGLEIRDGYTYLICSQRRDYDYLAAQLKAKRNAVTAYEHANGYILGVYLTEKGLEKLGVGFPFNDSEQIRRSGLDLIPRLRDWGSATPQSLDNLRQTLQSLPQVALLTFNDEAIPALNNLPGLAGIITELDLPIGTYEFFNQQGLAQLGYLTHKNVIRVHAISENDMARLTPAQALERYQLAVSERNIRVLLVRFFGINNPDSVLERSLDYVAQVKEGLVKEGFKVGQAATFNSLPYSGLLNLLLGLGAIGAALLLLQPYLSQRRLLALSLLGILGWFGLFIASPTIARKVMALATVVLFPVVGIQGALQEEGRGLGQAAWQLLKISAVSLSGALIMTGLLADKAFMLMLDGFSGVKLAHLAPILILALVVLLRQKRPWEGLQKLASSPVLYIHAILGLIIVAALAVYVIRTGNTGTALVSNWEIAFREGLDKLMGVRPRTKEFLLGHPLLLLVLYYGFDLRKSVLLLFGLIGQISLINTYAHIHTPLMVSLTRSFHGLWLGVAGGICLILLINLALKYWAGRQASE